MNLKKISIYVFIALMGIGAFYSYILGTQSEAHLLFFLLIGIIFYYYNTLNDRTTLNEEDIVKLIKEVGEMQKIQDGEEPEGAYEVIDTQKENIEVPTKSENKENVDKIENN